MKRPKYLDEWTKRGHMEHDLVAAARYAKGLEVVLANVRAALADPEPTSFEAYLLGLVNGEEPVE
jgi:hypothetical protein